jgi:GT2 family glycosyltransferase
MTTPARLTVVVLNYNYAQYLPRSVGSALAQDWPEVEVVVVDDCSTDNSRDVIAGFGGQVIPVLQPKNGGHGAGFNAGFAASSGEVVMFLDADDFLHPHAARRIMESRRADAAQYQYRLDLVDADEKVIDVYPPRETAFDDGDVRKALLSSGRYSTTVTTGLAFERRALQQVLPMDAEAFRQGGDGYLVTVVPLYGKVVSIEEILGAYRQHGANHSQFNTAVAKRARWRVFHDEMRHNALQEHARRVGLTAEPNAWRNDPLHLEERVASLLLEPSEHPDPQDRRSAIARAALSSPSSMGMSGKRRQVMRAWWTLVGYGPKPLAQMAVSWKLQAATRPAVVRKLARVMRRATA